MTPSLAGKTALVTGASRGIGAAIADALGAAGARVGLLARTRKSLDAEAAVIGNGAFAIKCDVTSASAIAAAVREVESQLGGPPDILVNNVGLFTIKAIGKTPSEEFHSIVATNLAAPFTFLNAFLPAMRKRGSGHIITIGSIADRQIFAGNAAYSAAKYGSRAVHEVLRAETRGTGIRATLVSPAAVDTDIWDPIQYLDTGEEPDRTTMLSTSSVADAVLFSISQPPEVNIDELRLSRS